MKLFPPRRSKSVRNRSLQVAGETKTQGVFWGVGRERCEAGCNEGPNGQNTGARVIYVLFFSVLSIILALLLQLPPFRSSHLGRRVGTPPPLRTTVHAFTIKFDGKIRCYDISARVTGCLP